MSTGIEVVIITGAEISLHRVTDWIKYIYIFLDQMIQIILSTSVLNFYKG